MIDDDGAWFWRIPCLYTLFLSISEPIFCISTPSNIFIFSNETCTISPNKATASFIHFEIEGIATIGNFCLIIHSTSYFGNSFFSWNRRLWSWRGDFFYGNRGRCNYFFIWIFGRIREKKGFPNREYTPLFERISQEDSVCIGNSIFLCNS